MALIYGRNPVREALRGWRAASVRDVWVSERVAREPWLAGRELRIASSAELMARCGSDAHQGVCAHAGDYPYADAAALLAEREPLIVALDHVEDPHNLGSICRTAECAGATGVVIHERHSASVTAAVCKASAGAVEHIRLAQVRNVANFLSDAKKAGCWCYGAVAPEAAAPQGAAPQAAVPQAAAPEGAAQAGAVLAYDEPDYSGGVVLVLGSEGAGLRPRVAATCDQLIGLPVRGRVSSLGVSAAAAALLYGILQSRENPLDNGR